MDALFFLKHSPNEDIEIHYALRALARHAPWVRRVIVFGDRPAFLAGPEGGALHMPHESIAWAGPYKTPVTNFFLLFYLSALLPELGEEFLWFCDDFVLLRDLSPDESRRVRFLEDLGKVTNRGRGLWKDALWRTYDTLARLGYEGLNYETHTPTYFRKRWVLEAFRDLRDYVTEDRWFGLTGPTAILNHARKQHGFLVVSLHEEGSRAGFYGKPPSFEEAAEKAKGKRFLSYDDEAFGPGLRRFLAERFPEPCKYEAGA
jgi:hypothetical protein